MLNLKDKRVVVTGASSGIGRCAAVRLAARGAHVAVCARRRDRLEALRKEMVAAGLPAPLVVPCDVTDPVQVDAMQEQVHQAWGGADVLINNAGRGACARFEELDPDVARRVVETNLMGVIRCTQAFLPGMLAQGSGRLVFVSSALAELPAPRHAVYGATKFAVSGLAETLDYELRPRGVRTLLVEPGLVRTEFAQVSGTPLERLQRLPHSTAEQVARALVKALEREERRCIPDRLAAVAIAFRRHFPRTWRLVFKMAIGQVYDT